MAIGRQLGFEQVVFGAVPSKQTALEGAFICSNFPTDWLAMYRASKLHFIDPVVAHCMSSSLPLVWASHAFTTPDQQAMYEEACGHGIRGGISLPIHGPNGEFGILSLVSDVAPDRKFRRGLSHFLSALGLLRDYAFDSSMQFLRSGLKPEAAPRLTNRELEVLKWIMAGKSSWEIAKIGSCSEATVNFHIANLRKKFDVNSRGQAVAKAMRLGIICPG